jgi:hypothetical protein
MPNDAAFDAALITKTLKAARGQAVGFAFGVAGSAEGNLLAVDRKKTGEQLFAAIKKAGLAKGFWGTATSEGSAVLFASEKPASGQQKLLEEWFRRNKVGLKAVIGDGWQTEAEAIEAPPLDGAKDPARAEEVAEDEVDEEEDEEEEEEPTPRVFTPEEVAKQLARARKRPVSFAFGVGADPEGALLALHARHPGKKLGALIKQANQATKGSYGQVTVEGRLATFRCEKAPIAGLKKLIRARLKLWELEFKVAIMGPEGEVVEPGDEVDDAEALDAEGLEAACAALARELSPLGETPVERLGWAREEHAAFRDALGRGREAWDRRAENGLEACRAALDEARRIRDAAAGAAPRRARGVEAVAALDGTLAELDGAPGLGSLIDLRERTREALLGSADLGIGIGLFQELRAALDAALAAGRGVDQGGGPDLRAVVDLSQDMGGVETDNDKAKLIDGTRARNVHLARQAVQGLVSPEGEIAAVTEEMIGEVAAELRAAGAEESPQGRHIVKVLRRLKEDPGLAARLEKIGEPKPGSAAERIVRATLGLGPDAKLTAADARRAAMSALVSELRQHDVGSCFGTSVAIHVHNRQPERMLDDLAQLVNEGRITRTVKMPPGPDREVAIPIPERMSRAALDDRKLSLDDEGRLTKVGAKKLAEPTALHETPPFRAAMAALGLKDGQDEAVEDALDALRRTAAADKALGLLAGKIDAKKLLAVSEDLFARIARGEDPGDAIRDACDDAGGIDEDEAEAAGKAADEAMKPDLPLETNPAEVLRRIAMDRAGVSEAERRALEEFERVGAAWRAESLVDQDGARFKELTAEHERLDALITGPRDEEGKPRDNGFERLEAYRRALAEAEDAYLGQGDNRLLRAWEYAVTEMAEAGAQQRHGAHLRGGIGEAVKDALEGRARDLAPDPTDEPLYLEMAERLRKEFDRLVEARIGLNYDASMANSSATDGSSSRGGFALCDTTLPGAPVPIRDARAFAEVIGGLMLNAFVDAFPPPPKGVEETEDEKRRRNVAREVAEALGVAATEPGFAKACVEAQMRKINPKGSPDITTKVELPWEIDAGDLTENLLPVYYGTEYDEPERSKIDDANGLAYLVLGKVGTVWDDLSDAAEKDPDDAGLPMGSEQHAFLLRPGAPSFREYMEGLKAYAAANSGDPDADVFDYWNNATDVAVEQSEVYVDMKTVEEIVTDAFGQKSLDRWMVALKAELDIDGGLVDHADLARTIVEKAPEVLRELLELPEPKEAEARKRQEERLAQLARQELALTAQRRCPQPIPGKTQAARFLVEAVAALPLSRAERKLVEAQALGSPGLDGFEEHDMISPAAVGKIIAGAVAALAPNVPAVDEDALEAAVRGERVPPLAADPKTGEIDGTGKERIRRAIRFLPVPGERRAEVEAKVLERLRSQPPAEGELDVSKAEDAMAGALAELKLDDGVKPRDVRRAFRAKGRPTGLVFADTNWGDGNHRTVFSLVVNGFTGETELWQSNEDGSDPKPMDADKWIKGKTWQVSPKAAAIGGA